MSLETWSILASIATAVGTLLAGFGLVCTWVGIRQNTRALELQVLESIFRDIRELDREYLADFPHLGHDQQNAWSATFFNTVEYLCFIVNSKITRDELLNKFFFQEALPAWRKLLIEQSEKGIIRDSPEMFPEFKKAYNRFGTQH